jgi:hypothetical protein
MIYAWRTEDWLQTAPLANHVLLPLGSDERLILLVTSILLSSYSISLKGEKKRSRLLTKRRGPGGRDVHEDLLTYQRFLSMLQYVVCSGEITDSC